MGVPELVELVVQIGVPELVVQTGTKLSLWKIWFRKLGPLSTVPGELYPPHPADRPISPRHRLFRRPRAQACLKDAGSRSGARDCGPPAWGVGAAEG